MTRLRAAMVSSFAGRDDIEMKERTLDSLPCTKSKCDLLVQAILQYYQKRCPLAQTSFNW